MTQAEIIALLRQKAFNYAVARGAPDQADAFFRAITAIAYGESGLNPNAVRDTRSGNDSLVASGQAQRELSVGLFQNNIQGGRGSGYSAEALKDPNLNIDISLASLWSAFQRAGGAEGFKQNPEAVTAYTYEKGQGSIPPSIDRQVRPGLALTSGNVPAATGVTIASRISTFLGQDPQTTKAAPPAGSAADNGSTTTSATPTAPIPASGPGWTAAQIARVQDRISRDEARRDQILSKPESARTEQDTADLARLQGDEVMGVTGSIAEGYAILQTLAKIPTDEANPAEFPANEANFAAGVLGSQVGLRTGALDATGAAYNTAAGLTNTAAGLMQTQAQLGAMAVDAQLGVLKEIFGSRDARATLIFNILDGNRRDAQEVVASAMQKGQLDQQAAENVLTAIATRQAAHLGYAAKVLEQAQWIDSVRYRNAMRRLPPGTMYQPGFEPDSTINSSLRALGLNPTVIHAQVVADAELDPLTALRDSDTAMPAGARPGADMDEAVAGVQAAAARVQDIKPYQGQEILPSDIGLDDLAPREQELRDTANRYPAPDFSPQINALGGYAYGVLGNARTYGDVATSAISDLENLNTQYAGQNATWRQPRVVQNPNNPPAAANDSVVPSSFNPNPAVDGGHWEGEDYVMADGRKLRGARSNPSAYEIAA